MTTDSERREDAAWRKNRGEYVMECPTAGCDYRTPPSPVDIADKLLALHGRQAHDWRTVETPLK